MLCMDIRKEIANCISFQLEGINFEDNIIESATPDKGDYSLPCFSFAKLMKESPIKIATDISNSVKTGDLIEKIEVVAGYINFFLNKEYVSQKVLSEFNVENFKSNEGNGKIVCVDYGSPNLAKYLHIGHLKTLIVGESLCRLFELKGYSVKRLNFIGDYGTPFGKIIGGLQLWGSLDDVKKRGNDALQDYYVKFNQAEEKDEKYSQLARDIFKKIVERDKEVYPIYEFIIKIALEDAKKMFALLGVEFDDYRGEFFYENDVDKVINLLNEKHLLKVSQGAKIVELPEDISPAVVVKSDGTTLYITRDISAAIDRYKDYKFDKMIYVTDVAQSLHFKQLFKMLELAGFDFSKNMEHVAYGRFSLPDGKISSRRGKQAVLVDLMEYTQNKANDVIKDRHFEIEDPKNVASTVASAVLNFNVLKVERIKDCVFDIEKAFSFEGETAPYMQYTYTRLESIIRKYEEENVEADYSCLNEECFELIKLINSFNKTLDLSSEKRDSSLIVKRAMDMCKAFNKLYTTTKVLDGNSSSTKAKVQMIKALRDTLKLAFNLVCIGTLQEM